MAFDTSKLQKILDLPTFDWESLNPIPAPSAAGSFVRSQNVDAYNIRANFFAVNATSSIWFYCPETDTCQLLPASGLSGTFAAGACGRARPFGPSGTFTAGSATTGTTNLTITRDLRGMFIRITGGPGAGDVRKIASNTIGANSVITVSSSFSATITASSTYQLLTPRLFVFNPHTASPWAYFRYYDWALNTWSSDLTITGMSLGAAWGTDAQMAGTASIFGNSLDSSNRKVFGSATSTVLTLTSGALWTTNQWTGGVITIVAGTGAGQVRTIASNTALTMTVDTAWGTTPDATSEYIIEEAFESSRGKTFGSATSTVLTLSAGSSWTTNQWANSQIRILSGTGAGQIRSIASNTSLTLTVSSAWTTTPDVTSVWLIEGNDDYLYITGNNATTFYRYSVSGNSASTLTARGGAAVAGCSLNWVYNVSAAAWTNPNAIKNGRYLYSFRGGATTLDIYDIAAGTWASQAYGMSGETFGTGTTYEYDDRDNLIIATAGSTSLPARLLRFDFIKTAMFPMGTVPRIQGTGVVGDKLFNIPFYADTGKRIDYVYHWRNSGQELCRAPIWYVY